MQSLLSKVRIASPVSIAGKHIRFYSSSNSSNKTPSFEEFKASRQKIKEKNELASQLTDAKQKGNVQLALELEEKLKSFNRKINRSVENFAIKSKEQKESELEKWKQFLEIKGVKSKQDLAKINKFEFERFKVSGLTDQEMLAGKDKQQYETDTSMDYVSTNQSPIMIGDKKLDGYWLEKDLRESDIVDSVLDSINKMEEDPIEKELFARIITEDDSELPAELLEKAKKLNKENPISAEQLQQDIDKLMKIVHDETLRDSGINPEQGKESAALINNIQALRSQININKLSNQDEANGLELEDDEDDEEKNNELEEEEDEDEDDEDEDDETKNEEDNEDEDDDEEVDDEEEEEIDIEEEAEKEEFIQPENKREKKFLEDVVRNGQLKQLREKASKRSVAVDPLPELESTVLTKNFKEEWSKTIEQMTQTSFESQDKDHLRNFAKYSFDLQEDQAQKVKRQQTDEYNNAISAIESNIRSLVDSKAPEGLTVPTTGKPFRPNHKHPNCLLCQDPHWRVEPINIPFLKLYLNESGDIIPRYYSGNCSKHQKKIARTIKHAKSLGLISYKKGSFTVIDPNEYPALPSEMAAYEKYFYGNYTEKEWEDLAEEIEEKEMLSQAKDQKDGLEDLNEGERFEKENVMLEFGLEVDDIENLYDGKSVE